MSGTATVAVFRPAVLPDALPAEPDRTACPGRALVVFCDDDGRIAWLRLLRPGFRHAFVAIQDGPHWITVDPLSPHTEVALQTLPDGFDLAGWFRGQGMTVQETRLCRDRRQPAPWAPFTCVEAVKRVLGLHAPWVLTPWQLHCHLQQASVSTGLPDINPKLLEGQPWPV